MLETRCKLCTTEFAVNHSLKAFRTLLNTLIIILLVTRVCCEVLKASAFGFLWPVCQFSCKEQCESESGAEQFVRMGAGNTL